MGTKRQDVPFRVGETRGGVTLAKRSCDEGGTCFNEWHDEDGTITVE
jgi:hypothetical protein